MSKKISVDIYGVCTVRDIFGLVPNNKFEIRKYYQLSYPPLFDNSDLFSINPMKPEEIPDGSGYNKRTAVAELNRCALDSLQNSGSEWVVIDLRSVPKGLYKVSFAGEVHYYSQCGFMNERYIKQSIEKKGLSIDSIDKIEHEDIPNSEEYFDKYCNFLKKRYGKKIILVELKEAMWLLDKDGDVHFKQDYGVEDRCRQMDGLFIKFLDKLDCYYVRTPVNIIYDSYNHFGDGERVHYVQEWYDYAYECIDLITSGDKDWLKKMDYLNIKLTNALDQIRGRVLLSRTNTLRRFEEKFKSASSSKEIDSIVKEMEVIVETTTQNKLKAELQGRIGRIYRDRTDHNSDLVKSAYWLRLSAESDIPWARVELFDVLWRINTPDATLEMIALAYHYSKSDAQMVARLAWAYRDGKGVQKDLAVAASWMKKSVEMGCVWAKGEYFEILWRIGTVDALKTMIEYGEKESNAGNLELRARLARAYRDGKGVKKDIMKALNLLRTVIPGPPVWSRWEYIDLLLMLGEQNTDKDAFEYAKKLTESNMGNKEIDARLAMMYKNGRGTSKNLNKAMDLMGKASAQGVVWAKKELIEMLWQLNDSKKDSDLLKLLTADVEQGNVDSMLKLAKCYRDGRGIAPDSEKMLFWLKKAADKNNKEAIVELQKYQ